MPRTKSKVENTLNESKKEAARLINDLIEMDLDLVIDVSTSSCTCSACKTIREHAQTVRGLIRLQKRVNKIEVA